MVWNPPLALWTVTLCVVGVAGHVGESACEGAGLVVYTAVFTTNWTRERFPKQYPQFRPPAQWSRLIGVSHDDDFRIFQLGTAASSELKLFAETGRQELLGNNNTDGHILDEFMLAAIKNGSGKVTGDFIVDTNHSKVSLVSRIVPSPDWFVGIDSLDLCSDGRWVDAVTVEASPLDAGTDSGFTFTAPNWATFPQEAIYKMTSQYPRHPANSFYYPRLTDLPPIATFQIIKKRTYQVHKPEGELQELSSRNNINQIGTTSHPVLAYDDAMQQNDVLPWSKKKVTKKKRSKKHKISKEKQCELGEWSEWSVCNAPCGQSKRTRKITKPGPICPALLEVRTCGCTKYIFNW